MARHVFFSFHYANDAWRASQVRNMGVVDGNVPVRDNDWEQVKRGGDKAIEKWIDDQLDGRSCAFDNVTFPGTGKKLSEVVTLYNPRFTLSTDVYANIKANIDKRSRTQSRSGPSTSNFIAVLSENCLKKREFVELYTKFLLNGTAGLFIGAGLSMCAGYPSWRQLVRDVAEEIGLDASREDDLAGIVQYFLNKAGKTRTCLARAITEHFGEEKPIPPVFRILARLPLARVWTTNYDTLPERAWREHRKRLDVKSRDKDVASENPWSHAVLYKMHGSVEHPSEVVIAKSDYEAYRRKHAGFLQLLTGHLISQHLLFLGFSFTDPNLSYLFTLIRESFEDTPPEHFAIVRRPRREEYDADAMFEYAKRRHALWVDDLQNYGLQCVEIDDYEEIGEILEAVERRLAMGSVMLSGSFPDTHEATVERARIEAVAQAVGRMLAKHNFRFVSGFGAVVGNAGLSGALEEYNKQETPNFERSLLLRPFPQLIPESWERQAYYRRYREDLATEAGVCVFIAGLKDEGGKREVAEGVVAEFEIATAAKRYPVPIGAPLEPRSPRSPSMKNRQVRRDER